MTDEPRLKVGDRVEWTGPSSPPPGLQRGERGWLEVIHPFDDIVVWDEAGTMAGTWVENGYVRKVGDRNEPDPVKRQPYDPGTSDSSTS